MRKKQGGDNLYNSIVRKIKSGKIRKNKKTKESAESMLREAEDQDGLYKANLKVRKMINTNSRKPNSYKLEESKGKVKKAKVKIKVKPLSSGTAKLGEGKLVEKKETYMPRPPSKGKTEESFQYYRDSYKKDPSPQRKKQLDEFLNKNPSYKTDGKLKRMRIRKR